MPWSKLYKKTFLSGHNSLNPKKYTAIQHENSFNSMIFSYNISMIRILYKSRNKACRFNIYSTSREFVTTLSQRVVLTAAPKRVQLLVADLSSHDYKDHMQCCRCEVHDYRFTLKGTILYHTALS